MKKAMRKAIAIRKTTRTAMREPLPLGRQMRKVMRGP